MTQIDLITGFLGSGKTTFLKNYAMYLKEKGENVAILENDYGAINVDRMLLGDINIPVEMVIGGDKECLVRRMKTKLISMHMQGYTYVLVEPSGIFDTDDFFDILSEEPLNNWYNIKNVYCVYDILTNNLDKVEKAVLANELSVAGSVIVTKRDIAKTDLDINYLNKILNEYGSERVLDSSSIFYNNSLDYNKIAKGYRTSDVFKNFDNGFDSLFIFYKDLNLDILKEYSKELLSEDYGKILRIKGFILEDGIWNSFNATPYNIDIEQISVGQNVVIFIGEKLNKDKIRSLFKKFIIESI